MRRRLGARLKEDNGMSNVMLFRQFDVSPLSEASRTVHKSTRDRRPPRAQVNSSLLRRTLEAKWQLQTRAIKKNKKKGKPNLRMDAFPPCQDIIPRATAGEVREQDREPPRTKPWPQATIQ